MHAIMKTNCHELFGSNDPWYEVFNDRSPSGRNQRFHPERCYILARNIEIYQHQDATTLYTMYPLKAIIYMVWISSKHAGLHMIYDEEREFLLQTREGLLLDQRIPAPALLPYLFQLSFSNHVVELTLNSLFRAIMECI